MYLAPTTDPIDLKELATSIRRSSNFRFTWQFFTVTGKDLDSIGTVAELLSIVIEQPQLHSFLAKTLDEIYPRHLEVEPLHKHASIVLDPSSFLDTMARASLDRLGAYSRNLSPATADEREVIHKQFSQIGRYWAFTIDPGNSRDCSICQQHNNHLFSNWFYGVAWDYIFLVSWPHASVFWIGCLTDTD